MTYQKNCTHCLRAIKDHTCAQRESCGKAMSLAYKLEPKEKLIVRPEWRNN
jgi:hypothetical protein